jgi:hypothetical protein
MNTAAMSTTTSNGISRCLRRRRMRWRRSARVRGRPSEGGTSGAVRGGRGSPRRCEAQ